MSHIVHLTWQLEGFGLVVRIVCPAQWDGEPVIQFVNQLSEQFDVKSLVVDFCSTRFVKPYGTILVAHALRQLVAERRSRGLKTSAKCSNADIPAVSYLRHVGFFQYVGLSVGRKLGEASGSATYVPIREVSIDELEDTARGSPLHQGIKQLSEDLANVIAPDSLPEQIMLEYCIREVIRNVFEHAEVDSCTVLAQRYGNGEAEIAMQTWVSVYTAHCPRTVLCLLTA